MMNTVLAVIFGNYHLLTEDNISWVNDLLHRKSPATGNGSIIPRTHPCRQIQGRTALNKSREICCDSSSVGDQRHFCFLYPQYFLFKDKVSFWSWEILTDQTTNWKPAIISEGFHNAHSKKPWLFISGSDSLQKNQFVGGGGSVNF